MSEWKEYRLGDVTEWSSGGTPSKKNNSFWNGDIPWISASSMKGNRYSDSDLKITESGLKAGSRIAEKDTILLLVRGSTLHQRILVGITEKNVAFNQDVKAIKPKKEFLDSWYLLFWFMSIEEQLLDMVESTGIGAGKLDTKRLQNLIIKIPPKEVRESITAIAKNIDDKLIVNQQTNQTLEAIAQTLFKSWFVDFDPVKAKLSVLAAGGSAEEAERAAMCAISARDGASLNTLQTEQPEAYAELARTAALFPSAMQDSELGEIPEGWELSEIGKEVTILGGGTPSTKQPEFWDNGDICWTTPKDLSNATDQVILDTERKITKDGLNKISSGLLPTNTVLLSSRAPVGYLALTKVPLAINQGYIAMRCEQNLPPEYVLLWASSVMDEIKQRASGTTFAEISKKNFRPIKVVVPPKAVLDIFTQRASNIYNQIANHVSENSSLTRVRDTLLPKLLSGELTVTDTTPPKANPPESDMLNAGSVPAEVMV